MLNWIAIWIADYFFGLGGPLTGVGLQPELAPILSNTHLPVFWGDPLLQGLHVGFFIAIAMLVVYWVILNRTTLGFEVRAVGFNPEASRYGGISVKRSYFLAMAISGAFAGLAGAVDILGWEFSSRRRGARLADRLHRHRRRAARPNSAVGIFFAAILFGALSVGTSTRQLDPTVFDPQLAGNLR